MSTESSRDDFIIAIRSAFLKKGNRQKFSLFTLLIISILVLLLEYFKTGPVNQFRSITKDIIFRGSYVVSSPFKYVKDKYYLFQDHMSMYEEFSVLRDKDLDLDSLRKEVDFYKSENALFWYLINSPNEPQKFAELLREVFRVNTSHEALFLHTYLPNNRKLCMYLHTHHSSIYSTIFSNGCFFLFSFNGAKVYTDRHQLCNLVRTRYRPYFYRRSIRF